MSVFTGACCPKWDYLSVGGAPAGDSVAITGRSKWLDHDRTGFPPDRCHQDQPD